MTIVINYFCGIHLDQTDGNRYSTMLDLNKRYRNSLFYHLKTTVFLVCLASSKKKNGNLAVHSGTRL